MTPAATTGVTIVCVSARSATAATVTRAMQAISQADVPRRRSQAGRSCTPPGPPAARPRGAIGRQPFLHPAAHAVVIAVDEDAVDDVEAQNEDPERPPGVRAADRQQGADRAQAGSREPDD